MNITQPELAFERLLMDLEREIINLSEDEISAIASELGIKPGMKGSIALAGVTRVVRLKNRHGSNNEQNSVIKDQQDANVSRRNPKRDAPSST